MWEVWNMAGPRLVLSTSTQHSFLPPRLYHCMHIMCQARARSQGHHRHREDRAWASWRLQSSEGHPPINKETVPIVQAPKGQ